MLHVVVMMFPILIIVMLQILEDRMPRFMDLYRSHVELYRPTLWHIFLKVWNQITIALSLAALTKGITTREWEDEDEEYSIDTASVQRLRLERILLKGIAKPEDEIRVVHTCLPLHTGSIGFYRPSHRNNKQASKKPLRRMPELSSSKTFLQPTRPTQHQHLRRRNKLKLHQDRNESRRSLDRELTVAHMSLGNDIEFLSGNMSDREKASWISLDFGSVLRVGV